MTAQGAAAKTGVHLVVRPRPFPGETPEPAQPHLHVDLPGELIAMLLGDGLAIASATHATTAH
jgi:hypothetical protein